MPRASAGSAALLSAGDPCVGQAWDCPPCTGCDLINAGCSASHQQPSSIEYCLPCLPHGVLDRWLSLLHAAATSLSVNRIAGSEPAHGGLSEPWRESWTAFAVLHEWWLVGSGRVHSHLFKDICRHRIGQVACSPFLSPEEFTSWADLFCRLSGLTEVVVRARCSLNALCISTQETSEPNAICTLHHPSK